MHWYTLPTNHFLSQCTIYIFYVFIHLYIDLSIFEVILKIKISLFYSGDKWTILIKKTLKRIKNQTSKLRLYIILSSFT